MASRALFGAPGGRSRRGNLVEFKAGKMNLKGNMCHADKRKGLVYIYESEDSLMHFCWKDRTSGEVLHDLLIFPDDATFKHVPQCTTGRVYVLKFNNATRHFIFWMQEPKSDKDEEYCTKVNKLLNSPGSSSRGGAFPPGTPGGITGLPADLSSLAEGGDLQGILGNMSQQQLIQLLGGMGMTGLTGGGGGLGSLGGGGQRGAHSGSASQLSADSPTPLRVQSSPGPRAGAAADVNSPTEGSRPTLATPAAQRPVTAAPAAGGTPGGTPAPIQLSDLQNILQSMNVPGATSPTPGGAAAAGGASSVATPAAVVDLVKTLGSSEVMIPILANKEVQDRLTPFLPTGEVLPSSEEELRSTFSSNQYHQALRSFGEALQSGQLGPLLNQFGLTSQAVDAANRGDVEAFAQAVQESEAEHPSEKMDQGE